jgi:hypothetical protein
VPKTAKLETLQKLSVSGPSLGKKTFQAGIYKNRYTSGQSVIKIVSKLHTETVPAQHNTRHKANGRQTDGR